MPFCTNSLRYLCKNNTKIRENWRLRYIARPTSGLSEALSIPPTEKSGPGNDGESDRAGIRMNTAHPIRIQYS